MDEKRKTQQQQAEFTEDPAMIVTFHPLLQGM